MRNRLSFVAATLAALTTFSPARAAEEETWDGLARATSKKLERVYLLPGADFRAYSKVTIAAPEVSFRKNWAKDASRGVREPGRRITEADVQRLQKALSEGFAEILAAEFTRAGWQVVSAAGPDVLRLTPILANVDASAPPKPANVRVDSYAVQTGEATVALEVRDAETAQLLGRAVDRRSTGDIGRALVITDRVTNRSDFQALLMAWSRTFVEGLAALKEASPLGAGKGGT